MALPVCYLFTFKFRQTVDMIDSGETVKGVCVCLCDPELSRRETLTVRLQTEDIVLKENHLSVSYVDTEGKWKVVTNPFLARALF